ncbi:hypothetical protein BDY21DRAFT_167 [Lineolata rhizophorae]|uniref:Uncharacterized protein n=1 Tax=Lineolata rhizophorae TaxID=578093 RepID=A0A6A6PCP8_9PEZI|nr:hypothetical protein BDY21DRAFT_167 [Lineolata rhizophorae]
MAQAIPALDIPPPEDDMEISSDFGRMDDDIEIDLDTSGPPPDTDDFMVDDSSEQPQTGHEEVNKDDVMLDEEDADRPMEDDVTIDEHLTDAEPDAPPPLEHASHDDIDLTLDGESVGGRDTGDAPAQQNEANTVSNFQHLDGQSTFVGESTHIQDSGKVQDVPEPFSDPDENKEVHDTNSVNIRDFATDSGHDGSSHQTTVADATGETASDRGIVEQSHEGHEDAAISQYVEHHEGTQEVHEASGSHPVSVLYEGSVISLFPPRELEESETFFLQDETLVHSSIGDLLQSCRQVLGDTIQAEDELEIDIAELGLCLSEDSVFATTTSLATIIDVFVQLHQQDGDSNPGPLHMALNTKTRFSSRLTALMHAAEEGKGMSELPFLNGNWEEVKEHEDTAGSIEKRAGDQSTEVSASQATDFIPRDGNTDVQHDDYPAEKGDESPHQEPAERNQNKSVKVANANLDDSPASIDAKGANSREFPVPDEFAGADQHTANSLEEQDGDEHAKSLEFHEQPSDNHGEDSTANDYAQEENSGQEQSGEEYAGEHDADGQGHADGEYDGQGYAGGEYAGKEYVSEEHAEEHAEEEYVGEEHAEEEYAGEEHTVEEVAAEGPGEAHTAEEYDETQAGDSLETFEVHEEAPEEELEGTAKGGEPHMRSGNNDRESSRSSTTVQGDASPRDIHPVTDDMAGEASSDKRNTKRQDTIPLDSVDKTESTTKQQPDLLHNNDNDEASFHEDPHLDDLPDNYIDFNTEDAEDHQNSQPLEYQPQPHGAPDTHDDDEINYDDAGELDDQNSLNFEEAQGIQIEEVYEPEESGAVHVGPDSIEDQDSISYDDLEVQRGPEDQFEGHEDGKSVTGGPKNRQEPQSQSAGANNTAVQEHEEHDVGGSDDDEINYDLDDLDGSSEGNIVGASLDQGATVTDSPTHKRSFSEHAGDAGISPAKEAKRIRST